MPNTYDPETQKFGIFERIEPSCVSGEYLTQQVNTLVRNMMQVVSENRRKMSNMIGHHIRISEDELWFRVDFFESSLGAFVENSLVWKALVLVEVVGGHASSELCDISGTELGEDSLSGRAFIFSWEAVEQLRKLANMVLKTYKMILSSTSVDFFLVPPNMWTMFSIGTHS